MNPTHSTLFRRTRARRAAILVLVLWIVVILSVIAYSLTYEIRLGLKATSLGQRKLKARAIARAGLAKAVLDLRNDHLISMADKGRSNDTLEDVWTSVNKDKTEIECGDEGHFTARVVDDERKYDINMLNPGSRRVLEYLLIELEDVSDDDAKEIADAVLDYIDPDVMALPVMNLDEVTYYTEWGKKKFGDQLAPDWTFRPKNDPLVRIEELLEIPGITREMLFGNPEEVPQDPIERIDWLEEEDRSPALCDYLTVMHSAPVNLNTCSKMLLEALFAPMAERGGDPESLAEQVLQYRKTLFDQRTDGGYGILNPNQLRNAQIEPDWIEAVQALTPLGVRSTHFWITARGDFQGIQETMRVRVTIEDEQYAITPDNPDSFGKRDQKSSGKLEGSDYNKFDPAVRADRTEY